jgi:hypothetical protein
VLFCVFAWKIASYLRGFLTEKQEMVQIRCCFLKVYPSDLIKDSSFEDYCSNLIQPTLKRCQIQSLPNFPI